MRSLASPLGPSARLAADFKNLSKAGGTSIGTNTQERFGIDDAKSQSKTGNLWHPYRMRADPTIGVIGKDASFEAMSC